jgi:outer membrane protein OmpA-like peptidoglycan-associated protein
MRETSRQQTAPPSVRNTVRVGGQPLERAVRTDMEGRFRHSFAGIRVHADERAGQSARDVGAHAYTVGNHIVFAPGRYQPTSAGGRRLIAHELAHAIQQRHVSGLPDAHIPIAPSHGAHERDAAHVASSAAGARVPALTSTPGPAVQRQDAGDAGTDAGVDTGPSTPVIWFKLNSTEFRHDAEADSQVHFNDALALVKKHLAETGAAGSVVLHGYASEEGDPGLNQSLSERRAERVKALMVAAGVPAGQITAIGHGVATDLPTRAWNRRVEVELRPTVTHITMPAETITGRRFTNVCGPDITQALQDAVAYTRSTFAGWTPTQRDNACDALDSVSTGAIAWDIVDLHNNAWILSYRPDCATAGGTPPCGSTVQVGDQCYYAGSANYVIFGVMCKLCCDHYAAIPDLSGTYRFSPSSMRALIDIYKGSGVTGLGTPSANYGPSRDWALAGYAGWPSGGAPPVGDRSNCGPICPTPFRGPAFRVNWCPNLWHTSGTCTR